MDVNAKYRRWGWGAVIALIGVILIAGLIVAVSMRSPKPDNTIGATTTSSEENGGSNTEEDEAARAEAEKKAEEEAKEKAEAEKKAEEEAKAKAEAEKKAKEEEAAAKRRAAQEQAAREEAARQNNMPHTGPTESMAAVVAFAVIAYLFALNVSLVKKQTH